MSAAVRKSQQQLSALQKTGKNKWCFECQTASPQWASPKYGIFICLECAGTHRSLGVHISFVRSVTMDQFKPEELKLMEIGGNDKAYAFFTENGIDDSVSIVDKYNSTVAEDYREKLAAEAKGETWTRADRPVHIPKTQDARAAGNSSRTVAGKADDSSSNAYKQFQRQPENEPTLNELASDAMTAISSGWGWFSKTVTQTVTETTDTYIRPGMRQFAESEMGGNARRAVEQFGRKAREAGVYGAEQFNKYAVEAMGGEDGPEHQSEASKSEYAHLFDGWRPRDENGNGSAEAGSEATTANGGAANSATNSGAASDEDSHRNASADASARATYKAGSSTSDEKTSQKDIGSAKSSKKDE